MTNPIISNKYCFHFLQPQKHFSCLVDKRLLSDTCLTFTTKSSFYKGLNNFHVFIILSGCEYYLKTGSECTRSVWFLKWFWCGCQIFSIELDWNVRNNEKGLLCHIIEQQWCGIWDTSQHPEKKFQRVRSFCISLFGLTDLVGVKPVALPVSQPKTWQKVLETMVA